MSRPRKDPAKLQDRRPSRTAPRIVELNDERDRRRREELSAQRPPRLLKLTAQHWAAYWESDVASIARSEDLPSLKRLFMLRDERERLWNGYRKERFVLGSRQPIAMAPVLGAIRALDAEIIALEDRFGLNPRARARLGLSFAQATISLAELHAKTFAAADLKARDEPDPRDEPDQSTDSKELTDQ